MPMPKMEHDGEEMIPVVCDKAEPQTNAACGDPSSAHTEAAEGGTRGSKKAR